MPSGAAPSIPRVEFSRILIGLRLTGSARFHFNHGGALRGLTGAALDTHDLPVTVIPFAPESGRVMFDAGDRYQLGVTLCGDSLDLAKSLIDGLQRVGRDSTKRATLSGNFEVVSHRQLHTPDLAADVERLRSCDDIAIRFLSPFRLERPPALKVARGAYLTADCFPVNHFLRRLWKRIFLLANARYPDATDEDRARPPLPADEQQARTHLHWLDVPVESQPRPGREKGYTLGGVVGTVTIPRPADEWVQALALARYLHIGESSNYGFGRYRFCDAGLEAQEDFAPATSLLETASQTSVLSAALLHLRAESDAAGTDGESPDEFEALGAAAVGELGQQLKSGTYRPQPLLGFLQRKPDGRVRPLAIPTVRDRLAQRAVGETLTPAIDSIFEDCSFAYRKGFSRQRAARAIEEAWGQGYRYVLDADISAFFDTVDWQRLFEKLHALFPFEPAVELMKAWVRAPVVFDGRRIERKRGLPQGSPISPFLANLFLDEFDEELLGRDFRLVRYADDFVVLCRNLDEARNAHEQAQTALERIGLSLNESKTEIRAIDSGFTYLGYLFCRSLVSEEARPDVERDWDLPADAVPSASWLAQVPFERVKALVAGQRGGKKPLADPVALRPASGLDLAKRPLYVANIDTRLELRDETLVLERAGEPPIKCPIRSLLHVTFIGRMRATLPLVVKLHELGVPVYQCRRNGELLAAFVPHAPDWPAWLAQARLAQNGATRLVAARALVAAKLHNTASLVRRFPVADGRAVAGSLRDIEADALAASDIERLVGYEGRGAALFFDTLRRHIEPAWAFDGRKKNPPPDPVNSMLSFGYTMIYNHVSTSLVAAGLNPRLGVFHEERGTHHALASDVMEPFRYLVDGLVWAMLKRREVTPVGFLAPEEGRGMLMTHELRRTFIARLERRLLEVHTPTGRAPESYRETMDRAARQMREFIVGRESEPWVFRVGDRRVAGEQAAATTAPGDGAQDAL